MEVCRVGQQQFQRCLKVQLEVIAGHLQMRQV
jgi:hypothetical protein